MEKALRTGRLLPLTELLPKMNYPKDVGTFYAQSLSLTDYMITGGGRKKFLAFVARGVDHGWDKAAQSVYGNTVEELEGTWLEYARKWLPEKPADSRPDVSPSYGNQQPALQPAPTNGEALPARFKEKLPDGPAPIQALVVLHKDRRLSVSRKVTCYEPQTETFTLKNGQKHQVSYYNEKYYDSAAVYDLQKVRVHDTNGRAVDADKLRERLRRETLALISANGRPVDRKYLRLYKEDTLVFVLPSEPLRAVPGEDPIAPPPTPGVSPVAPPPPGIMPVPNYSVQPAPAAAPAPMVIDPPTSLSPSRP
jgi:hypothetical protein